MKIASALILAFVAGAQAQPSVNISALPTITIPPPPSLTLPTLTLPAPTLPALTSLPPLSFGPGTTSASITSTSLGAAIAGSYADTGLVMGAVAGLLAFLV